MKNFYLKNKQGWIVILKLAWPLIIANGFWIIQTLIDRIYLAQYSTNALAAATAVSGVFWAPMALIQQTAAYSMTFVAQYLGAKKFHMVGASVWQAIYFSIFGGLAFLLLIFLSPFFFQTLGHSQTLTQLEISYFNAICFAALPFALTAVASGFFAGIGRSEYILPINAAGVIANIIFDELLIFGHFGFKAYGIAGAGYATALANIVACIVGFGLIFNKPYEIKFKIISAWKLNMSLMRNFIRFAIPSGLQFSLEGLAFSVFLIIIGKMPEGQVGLAASGIAVSVMMLAIMPTLGLSQAVSVLVGQHIGKNTPGSAARLAHNGYQIALVYVFFAGLSFIVIPDIYLLWFKNTENLNQWIMTQEMSYILLLFVGLFIPFDALNLIYAFALKGAGDTKFVSLVSLLAPWPIMVIPSYIFIPYDNAIYWSWGFSSLFIIFQGVVFYLRFLGGKWKHMKVI